MPGYWQFQFDDITIDGKKTGTCGCCHVWGLESGAAWQEFPVKSFTLSDGRLAVSLLKLFQKKTYRQVRSMVLANVKVSWIQEAL